MPCVNSSPQGRTILYITHNNYNILRAERQHSREAMRVQFSIKSNNIRHNNLQYSSSEDSVLKKPCAYSSPQGRTILLSNEYNNILRARVASREVRCVQLSIKSNNIVILILCDLGSPQGRTILQSNNIIVEQYYSRTIFYC